MSARETIIRHTLILQKLRKSPASFEEISEFLAEQSKIQEYDFNISKRTFQRDKNDILSIFNIDILYNTYTGKYHIEEETTYENDRTRFLEAFDTFNALKVTEGLSKYIRFESRKPLGTQYLYDILNAIKDRLQIEIEYQKYYEEESSNRTLEPYLLKEFKHRWYILANDKSDDKIKSFALDRVSSLEVSKKKFKVKTDFKANEHFKNSFGIITPNDQNIEEVILSFVPFQGKYIKDLPLHHSQEILIDNEEELRIKLKIYITIDFIMELLSFGHDLKVIQPQSLADDLRERYKKAEENYK